MFMMKMMKFYPSAVFGALVLDGINAGLLRVALHFFPQRFLQHRPDFLR